MDISDYDIIIGYRADDSYFAFAQDFVSGAISLQKLSEAMRLGKLGQQIVLKSKKAFEKIQYIGYESVLAEEYYVKKMDREKAARQEYRKKKLQSESIHELFILDIMRDLKIHFSKLLFKLLVPKSIAGKIHKPCCLDIVTK